MKTNKITFIKYCFYASMTSLINIIVYFLVYNYIINKIIIANIFAYTFSTIIQFNINKKVIFTSNNKTIIEFIKFIIVKLSALLIDTLVLNFLVNNLNISNSLSKIISNLSTTITNYILNKNFVFKNKKDITEIL